jgi:4,5-DOPA dioxygenase extradiol
MTPAVFVSHGSPGLILEAGPSRDFLGAFVKELGRPRAIVCVSAHWETKEVTVNLSPHPTTIHDFYGFPEELYRIRYGAPGDPALGRRVLDLVGNATGGRVTADTERGFDHGVWSPLILMYPDASVPVVEVSVQPHRDAAHHLAVGRALAPLREEGILILGSGSATHNLRQIGRPSPHGALFESWIADAVLAGRIDDLVGYAELAPFAKESHPTPEHFLPLFAPLGAAGSSSAKGQARNRIFEHGSLSMAAFIWQ